MSAPAMIAVPLLRDGDRLTRDEFERRYEAMPPGVKAELVKGVVYMASPLSRFHGRPHGIAVYWLNEYARQTPGVEVYDNTTVRLDDTSEPQPDVALVVEPGGQTHHDDAYIGGAPELVVEVAISSAGYDLGVKRDAYEACGVREYVVFRPAARQVDWFTLGAVGYEPITPDTDGFLKSRVFPGLWLDPAAMISANRNALFAALEAGCRTPEHAAFAATLRP